MENIETIFNYVIEYAPVVLSVIFTLITFIKTGKVKNYIKEIENEMNYRSRNYRQNDETVKEEAQTFERLEKQYKVDKKTNSLVETGELIDLQEQIQSMAETALAKILAKFLPTYDEQTVTKEYERIGSDLDYLTEALVEIDSIKADYNLAQETTLAELQEYLTKKQANYKTEKEIIKNEEKKTVEESE